MNLHCLSPVCWDDCCAWVDHSSRQPAVVFLLQAGPAFPEWRRFLVAGASKHVRVLESAGLVKRTIRGRTHLCRLEAARLAEADAWLRRYERFWSAKLDKLEALLRAEDEAKAKQKQSW